MNEVHDLLRSAAHERAVGFDHRDVQQRAALRRRRRRSVRVAVAGGALAVLAVVGMSLRGTGGSDDVDVASSADPQRANQLIGRWTAFAYSAVVVPPEGVYLEFGEGGHLEGDDGCNDLTAEWEVSGDRLVVDRVASTLATCEVDTRLRELLLSEPRIGVFDSFEGSLELRAGDDFIAFERDS